MLDFLSEQTLCSKDFKFPEDLLSRNAFASRLIAMLGQLPVGTAAALQGSWGSGKTYVLATVFRQAREQAEADESSIWASPIWLNPWQYGTPDLLTPLVLAIASRIPHRRLKSDPGAIRTAIESLIRAGVNFTQKAASVYAIASGDLITAGLLKASSSVADKALGGLFKALKIQADKNKEDTPDLDYVAKMGQRFAELVDHVIGDDDPTRPRRLLVCVDDLDRCMPDRQLALLEAFRFMTAANARATFAIAIDPTLAHQAVKRRYRLSNVDAHHYLDKMFQLRIDLPPLDGSNIVDFVKGRTNLATGPNPQSLFKLLEAQVGPVAGSLFENASIALPSAALRNPRYVERLLQRLYFIALNQRGLGSLLHEDNVRATLLFSWSGICDRWPPVRAAFRAAPRNEREQRWIALVKFMREGTRTRVSYIDSIRRDLDLIDAFTVLDSYLVRNKFSNSDVATFLSDLEEIVIKAGL
jgi:hypothetical protein